MKQNINTEKILDQNMEKLKKFLENAYLMNIAETFEDLHKGIQKVDAKLSETTIKRLTNESIQQLDNLKNEFDEIVMHIVEHQLNWQKDSLKLDPSIKIKVRAEFVRKMISSLQDIYQKSLDESMTVLERESLLKSYFEKVTVVLVEMFKSNSTSTNTPQSGML